MQKLFGLSFSDACKKLDYDFSLHLYGKQPRQKSLASGLAVAKSRIVSDKKRTERSELEKVLDSALDELARLDKNKILYAPKRADEPLHPLFVEALNNLLKAQYAADMAQEVLYEYDRDHV